MALTGTFIADFASFDAACAKAVVSLKDFESGGAKVESRMNRMADSFSGRKIIEDAKLMATIFTDAGGAAGLTTAELQRMGTVGSEAMEKLRKTGEPIPENLRAMVRATRDVGDASEALKPKIGGLHDSLQSFDGILASMGIHIGPEIKAIGEIGAASATGAVGLGLVATAGLALGAGIAGWKVGRAAADFFDLDNKIANAAARLFGFGDRDAQVAAANTDKLAAASRMAGHEITDLGVATAILSAGMLTHRTAAEQSAAATNAWHADIAKVKAGGELPSLTADLASQNFSLEVLATRYGVSVESLQVFQREQTAAAASVTAANAVITKSNADQLKHLQDQMTARKAAAAIETGSLLALTKLEEDYNVTRVKQSGTADENEIAGIHQRYAVLEASLIKAGTLTAAISKQMAANMAQDLAGVGSAWSTLETNSIANMQDRATHARDDYNRMVASGGFYREELDKQLALVLTLEAAANHRSASDVAGTDAQTEALKRLNAELDKQKQHEEDLKKLAAENRAMGGSTQYDLSTAEGRAKVPADIKLYLQAGYSFEQASRLAYAMKMGFDVSRDPLFASKGPRVPGFLAGGPTTEGPAYLHDAEYVVPQGGALVMRGGVGGGGGPTIYNTFHLVDTESNLAKRVADKVLRQVQQGQR